MIIAYFKGKYFVSIFHKVYTNETGVMKVPLNPDAFSIQAHKGVIGISAFGYHRMFQLRSLLPGYGGKPNFVTEPIGEPFEVNYLGNIYLVQKTKQYVAYGKRLTCLRDQYTVLSINGTPEQPFTNSCLAQKTDILTIKHYIQMKKLFNLDFTGAPTITVMYLF